MPFYPAKNLWKYRLIAKHALPHKAQLSGYEFLTLHVANRGFTVEWRIHKQLFTTTR